MNYYIVEPKDSTETVTKWICGVMLLVLVMVLCCGCSSSPKSHLSLNLVDGILESDKENTDIDIGSIEYTEIADPNGVSKISIKVKSYKVTEAELAMEKEKAMVDTINKLITLTNTLMIGGGL